MSESIEERVLRVIATSKRLPQETVRADSTFEELGVDSLDRLNILFDLESEFDIEIDDEEARKVTNIHEMVDGITTLVDSKAEGKTPAAAPAATASVPPVAAVPPAVGRGELESGADELPEAAGAPEGPAE